MSYLWDTTVLIHALRNSMVFQTIDSHLQLSVADVHPTISIISAGELKAFAHFQNYGAVKTKRVTDLLAEALTIPIDETRLADIYGLLSSRCKIQGHGIGQNDLWIAATAQRYGLQILTMDKDFEREPTTLVIRFDPQSGAIVFRRDSAS